MLPDLLKKNATWLYGAYGIAQTMFNFPSSFIVPFAVSVVPAVAAAMSRGDRRSASRTIETAFRVTSVLALPAAAGLSVLAWPIMNLLFQRSPDEVRAATTPLTILAIAVSF
ncbi:MAG: lipid II flippase MurJ [Eubacteriales bacterium]